MPDPEKPRFPGVPTTTDGAGAVVWVETNIDDASAAYPITSSTTMGSGFEAAYANGYKNLWGTQLEFFEPESEHSSASACEGFALAGGRVTNFTSGQGLILMKEVLYTISGKRLPVVFHIGARALTSHSLNVHAGHDDVMGVADCGWGMLFARNAQEAGDLALIARRTAEDSRTPFLNIQDGFLTTHTVENVLLPEKEFMKGFVGDPKEKLINLMDPYNPVMSGVVQNQDAYMKGKIAQHEYYDRIEANLRRAMAEFSEATGRSYSMCQGYNMEGADCAIVALGCLAETAMAVSDWLLRERGVKLGVVNITGYRPFPGAELVALLSGVKKLAVLERMDDPLAPSNPLTRDIKAAFADALAGVEGFPATTAVPHIFTGAAGLGSRDVRPGDMLAVLKMLEDEGALKRPRRYFTLSIDHETALPREEDPDVRTPGSFSMRGHSVGGFGSVTTNKVIATIAADMFGKFVQAYPKYGSEKKGLPTTYFLTIAPKKIQTHCELHHVEFIPLNDVNAFRFSNPLFGLSEGGVVFIQTPKREPAAIWEDIPEAARAKLIELKARVVALDTVSIAREVSSRADLIMRMQGIVLLGIFLKVTPFAAESGMDRAALIAGAEKSIRKYFGS
ncbi:MAG: 2-oxoacid:acceptor oxidoreductase family protein, partial [Nitrospira sp.]|nr:2-oxoacid:acceptor oxidoreductase family protein [Nitrospira sp.]